MRRLVVLPLLAALLAASSGCAAVAWQNRGVGTGIFYADTATMVWTSGEAMGPKTGEACARSWFGVYTVGDASVATAARNGGISRVTHVDQRLENLGGVLATYCLVVTGY